MLKPSHQSYLEVTNKQFFEWYGISKETYAAMLKEGYWDNPNDKEKN